MYFNLFKGVQPNMDYKKLYAYLMGEVDEALTLLDTGNLLHVPKVREMLQNALLTAEEMYLDATEDE